MRLSAVVCLKYHLYAGYSSAIGAILEADRQTERSRSKWGRVRNRRIVVDFNHQMMMVGYEEEEQKTLHKVCYIIIRTVSSYKWGFILKFNYLSPSVRYPSLIRIESPSAQVKRKRGYNNALQNMWGLSGKQVCFLAAFWCRQATTTATPPLLHHREVCRQSVRFVE